MHTAVASFAGHAGRAQATTDAQRDGPPGFVDVTVLDRRSAAGGLHLVSDEAPLLRPSRAG
jgi:hypothetical protein